MATNKKSLLQQMKNELYNQYSRGKGISRHEEKQRTGTFAHHDKIYSSNSLKTHLTQVKDFAAWAKQQEQRIRNIEDITPDLVGKYLREREEQGNSPHTISARLLALNHVGISKGLWDRSLRKAEFDLAERRADTITNNRDSKGTMDDLTTKQTQIIEFGRTFGLRRSELVPNAHHTSNYAVGTKSLYEKENRLYLATLGKGGRYRTIEALKENEAYIRSEYAPFIQKVDKLPNRVEFEALRGDSTPLFDSISRSVPVHVLSRQYYANKKLVELERENRSYHVNESNQLRSGHKYYTTNSRTMLREHAQFLSDQLGHNRIAELKSYINLND
ncbi:MAG TPA: hypothetical protein DEA45_01390 [Acholeplasmataceae bacterium]|nr:hypothetical protein [Acholeplasmataceae bacterium]